MSSLSGSYVFLEKCVCIQSASFGENMKGLWAHLACWLQMQGFLVLVESIWTQNVIVLLGLSV